MTSIPATQQDLSPDEIATRFNYIRFALASLEQRTGGTPDWEFATWVYLSAVSQRPPPVDVTSTKAKQFIQSMFKLANSAGDNLDLAFQWKRRECALKVAQSSLSLIVVRLQARGRTTCVLSNTRAPSSND